MWSVWTDRLIFFLKQSLFKTPFHHYTKPTGVLGEEIHPRWRWVLLAEGKCNPSNGFKTGKGAKPKNLKMSYSFLPLSQSRFTQQLELWPLEEAEGGGDACQCVGFAKVTQNFNHSTFHTGKGTHHRKKMMPLMSSLIAMLKVISKETDGMESNQNWVKSSRGEWC